MLGISCFAMMVMASSCEKEVDMDVPGHTPKLAVQYSLSTEEPNKNMFVGRSQLVLSGNDLWRNGLVKDATVSIKDGSGIVQQAFVYMANEYNPEHGNYKPVNEFTPVPGKQYTLVISAGGFETIQSTLTMPVSVPVQSSSFTADAQNNSYNFSGRLRIQFNDLPGQNNYYRLIVRLLDAQGKIVGHAFSNNANDDIFGEEVEKIELNKVFDDGWAKQNVITFSDKVSYYNGGSQPTQLEVTLQHLTRDLFLYERSRENYEEDNPFAEPLNLHSNIQNGYGNFGGITISKFRVKM
ncbi:DUF4249 domain-containing protein [Rufibacter tibetensis]|nr:DUF4249 domain-containing protein [Rufibacter tibetensis]